MGVLIRYNSPQVIVSNCAPSLLNQLFTNVPMAVSVDLWVIAPATALSTTQAPVVTVNATVIPSQVIGSGANQTLTFQLGGLAVENAGALNSVGITAYDNLAMAAPPRAAQAAWVVQYYRIPDPPPMTTPPMTTPPVTTPPVTTPPVTTPPVTTPPVTTAPLSASKRKR
jgi:hypothetical protein